MIRILLGTAALTIAWLLLSGPIGNTTITMESLLPVIIIAFVITVTLAYLQHAKEMTHGNR